VALDEPNDAERQACEIRRHEAKYFDFGSVGQANGTATIRSGNRPQPEAGAT
jgi:hypothetical protein